MQSKYVEAVLGGVAEWSIAAVLKTVVLVRVPGVRIPLPPLKKADIHWISAFCHFSLHTGFKHLPMQKLKILEIFFHIGL